MSVLKACKEAQPSHWIGGRVKSVGVGSKFPFTGTVVDVHPGLGSLALVVRDDDGRDWHRWPGELTRVAGA